MSQSGADDDDDRLTFRGGSNLQSTCGNRRSNVSKSRARADQSIRTTERRGVEWKRRAGVDILQELDLQTGVRCAGRLAAEAGMHHHARTNTLGR